MIKHDYEKMSWHVDHIKRHIEHTPSAVEACITQGLTEYAEHQAKRYEARIAELEQGIDSQAILAAAKELGRVEVLKQMQALQGHSWELEFLDDGVRWWHYFDNSLSVIKTGNDSESLLAYLDSRGEDS